MRAPGAASKTPRSRRCDKIPRHSRRGAVLPPRGEMSMIKLGYKASAEQFGRAELLEFGVLAEELGLDSVWISDHFHPWRHSGGHAPFSLAWLGALGARTGKIVMGTSVLTPTY